MNRGYTYAERIDARGAGRVLLDYLAARYPHGSAAEWRERVGAAQVRVNGQPASVDRVLARGDTLTWARPPWEEPAATLSFEVLFEEPAFVAVAKPAGLPTLPGGGYLEHTLLALVRARFPEAAPLHRLDRGASGLVLFTRTAAAARAIASDWREGRVLKIYRALIVGSPAQDALAIETPIGRVSHPALGTVFAASATGLAARSDLRILERRGTESLVEVSIATGRPHQIRIHLAAVGHPLVGEPLYAEGGGLREDAARPGAAGYHLHACRLAFAHPCTGAPVDIHCPPPRALLSPTEREAAPAAGGPGPERPTQGGAAAADPA